jgi:hypothetical protein
MPSRQTTSSSRSGRKSPPAKRAKSSSRRSSSDRSMSGRSERSTGYSEIREPRFRDQRDEYEMSRGGRNQWRDDRDEGRDFGRDSSRRGERAGEMYGSNYGRGEFGSDYRRGSYGDEFGTNRDFVSNQGYSEFEPGVTSGRNQSRPFQSEYRDRDQSQRNQPWRGSDADYGNREGRDYRENRDYRAEGSRGMGRETSRFGQSSLDYDDYDDEFDLQDDLDDDDER